jgi:tight adherence protein B
MRLGKSPHEALDGVYERVGITEYSIFAVALAVQARSGGRLTETIQTLGDQVRERVTLAARAKAMAGEVIFSARALSVSPILMGGWLYWINPRMIELLFTDPTGRMLLAYAIASVIVGTLVIRWMVRRETMI